MSIIQRFHCSSLTVHISTPKLKNEGLGRKGEQALQHPAISIHDIMGNPRKSPVSHHHSYCVKMIKVSNEIIVSDDSSLFLP